MGHYNLSLRATVSAIAAGITTTAISTALGILGLGWTAADAQIRPSLPPMFGNKAVAPQFAPDPSILRGISGGEIAAEAVAGRLETETGPCLGYVSEKPDHSIKLNSFFSYLNLEIQGQGDTTLVIKGPGGTWCSDNVSGPNPSIAGQWMPGTYEVWIGSTEPEQYLPYQLSLTEVR